MTTPLGAQPTPPLDLTKPMWSGWFSTVQKILQATSSSGPTTARPTTNLYIGQFWYDTTLGYPVWVNAISPTIVWHNAAGAPV
jgi:hypothetical protein